MNKLMSTAAVLALSVPLALTAVPSAQAKGGNDVVRRGNCTGVADWKVKVGSDDGRLEVEGEVDSNHAGQRWIWTFKHNDVQFASGARLTAGRSGSFTVRRTPANRAGTDTIVFRAVRLATGQVCRGVVSY